MKTTVNSQSVAVAPKFDAPLRDASTLLKSVSFDDNGCVIVGKGSQLSVRDIPTLGAFYVSSLGGARDRVCGLLSFAEKQEPYKLTLKGEGDTAVAVVREMPALQFVLQEIEKSEGVSLSLLRECVNLLPKFKIAIANGFRPSAFYEASSPLEKLGSIDPETLILVTPSESDKPKRDSFLAIRDALKSGVPTNNGLRPIIAAEREKHPTLFPKRGAKVKGAVSLVAPAASGGSLTNDNTVIKSEIPKLTHDAASIRSAIQKARMALEYWRTQSDLATQEAVKAGKSLPEAKAMSETPENQEDAKVCHELVIQMCRSTNPNPVKK